MSRLSNTADLPQPCFWLSTATAERESCWRVGFITGVGKMFCAVNGN